MEVWAVTYRFEFEVLTVACVPEGTGGGDIERGELHGRCGWIEVEHRVKGCGLRSRRSAGDHGPVGVYGYRCDAIPVLLDEVAVFFVKHPRSIA